MEQRNRQNPMNVQCFVKREVKPFFSGGNDPKLLYVCEIRPDISTHPRVMHAHPDFTEISLICSGSSDYLIDSRVVRVKKGDILIYNPGVVHDERSGPDNEVGSYCIAVSDLAIPGLGKNELTAREAGSVFPTGENFEELKMLFRTMFLSLSSEEPGAEQYCTSLMHAVLIRVIQIVNRCLHTDGDVPEVEEPNVLGRRIKSYIDQHYREPLTLQRIGEELHISPFYCAHIFKEMSGYSMMQYLNKRRIGEAQTLLINTRMSIVDIAGEVGYDNQSYFSAQFTKNIGLPPGQYRKNYIVQSRDKAESQKIKK